MRMAPVEEPPLRLRFDGFELHEADARLSRDGRPVALTPKAFGVLCALARNAPGLVTKDALLDAVWGHRHVSESVLKTTISELRAALSDDARKPRYIETAARRGYRFIGASPVAADAAPAVAAPTPETMSLIGRGTVLARLQASWARARAGQRQLFWITGEAGIGKTTLIDRFVGDLGAGLRAHGQCVEQYGAGEPYLPVLEALGAVCRSDPTLPPLMRAVAPTWLLQLPWLTSEVDREALRRELTGTGQDRMLRELGELLDRYTVDRPLLLVTEDLHWSDHATLRLIDHVARRRQPARLMWLASFRLAEVIAEDHPLKALRHELRLHRLCEEAVLEPFSERELADYIGQRAPAAESAEGWVRRLHAHTDGLPLFVVNVLDDLLGQGALDAAPIADLPVPENLAGVIDKRIAALPDAVRTLLEAAGVCGVEFGVQALADALDGDVALADARCEDLVRQQHWLERSGIDGTAVARYRFRHALYRHVLYQRVGASARARLHLRIAASMERAGAAASELASHRELGGDPMAAMRHYAAAAENALRHFAPTEALQLTAHGLTLLPRCPEGPDRDAQEMALLGPRTVAASQSLGVTAPLTVAAFERVQILCERLPGKTSRALELGLGWVFYLQGEYARARTLAQRIEALAERRGDRLLHAAACNLMGAVQTVQGELAAGRQRLEQGLAVFAEVADDLQYIPFVIDLGVSMRARLGFVLANLGLVAQARTHLDAALARAEAIGQPYARMVALAYLGLLEVRLERPEQVRALAASLQQWVDAYAIIEGEGPALWLRGWATARLGQPEAGHALIVDGFRRHAQLGRVGGGSGGSLGYAVEALVLAGRWDEAQARLDEALELAQRIGERFHLPDLWLLGARIALGRGQPADARRALQAALAEARAQQASWPELNTLVALCECAPVTDADRAALDAACSRLAEGADTPLARRAFALLGRTGPSAEPDPNPTEARP